MTAYNGPCGPYCPHSADTHLAADIGALRSFLGAMRRMPEARFCECRDCDYPCGKPVADGDALCWMCASGWHERVRPHP